MLRLPPTAIVIVASEVRAYEERRQVRHQVFQADNRIKFVSEVESYDPERHSPSTSADVKLDALDTNSFRDDLAPSPDPSVLGNGGHDELVEALNNIAQGRSITFESPSLPVRLKTTRPDGTVFPSEDNSLIPDTPPTRMEALDAQPTANEASELHQIEMRLKTQRPSIRDGSVAIVASSDFLVEHKVFAEAGYSQPSLSSSLQLDGNHDFQIYNDEMPAAEQPQTPQNLPEARHRGRLGAAFTAPVTRIGMAQGSAAAAARAAIALVTPTTTSRGERARREPSPPGLNTPGFRGLYGGLENTDDAVLHETGYRMTNRGSRHLEAESNQEPRR
ncbi:hypothetical protein PspLS_05041 [Pyricularia sp. CBS 133598]|nr:hypothetical protein PspLS_05041 [Pyricularia sp. CBS 133598]